MNCLFSETDWTEFVTISFIFFKSNFSVEIFLILIYISTFTVTHFLYATIVKKRNESFQDELHLKGFVYSYPYTLLTTFVCERDRKSTRLNSSHVAISYDV